MLESMIEHPRPTRAEVSDVSHAVFAGADAVMLSAETASGAYPVKAVEMMDRVARQVEGWQWIEGAFRSITEGERERPPPLPLREAVARSTAQLSRDLQVRAVVVRTEHGTSAAVVSATRPAAPVMALTMDPRVYRRMNLLWGVIPQLDRCVRVRASAGVSPAARCELGLADEGANDPAAGGLRHGRADDYRAVGVRSIRGSQRGKEARPHSSRMGCLPK